MVETKSMISKQSFQLHSNVTKISKKSLVNFKTTWRLAITAASLEMFGLWASLTIMLPFYHRAMTTKLNYQDVRTMPWWSVCMASHMIGEMGKSFMRRIIPQKREFLDVPSLSGYLKLHVMIEKIDYKINVNRFQSQDGLVKFN